MSRILKRRVRAGGFTLVEMMVVIVIIGILATILIVNLGGKTDKAKSTYTVGILEQVDNAIELFKAENNRYPQALEELVSMPSDVDANVWQPYLKRYPLDGWDQEFIYHVPGSGGHPFDLLSLGADGREGGEGFDRDLWSRERR